MAYKLSNYQITNKAKCNMSTKEIIISIFIFVVIIGLFISNVVIINKYYV